MAKKLFVILDGVSETNSHQSSLFKAYKPNIDYLASIGESGFYLPERGYFHDEPKTDLVIPLFFGMQKILNPGRAALEIFDIGVELIPNFYSFGIKIFLNNNDINQKFIKSFFNDLKSTFSVAVHESNANNTGIKFILANIPPDIIKPLLSFLNQNLKVNFAIQDLQKVPWDFNTIRNIITKGIFLGWGKGALRGALKYLGFMCNPFERTSNIFFDWNTYSRDFNAWIRPQLNNINDFETFIFYTKETAFASRFNVPHEKVKCIEFMDDRLGAIISYFEEDLDIIILSDHSSNFSETKNPILNTFFVKATINPKNSFDIATAPFYEGAIKNHNQVISQESLIKKIFDGG